MHASQSGANLVLLLVGHQISLISTVQGTVEKIKISTNLDTFRQPIMLLLQHVELI
jgi:hypothetical protein